MLNILVDFEDRYVDDDFRAGAVEVVEDLLGEDEFVGSGAHDDSVLARDEVDLDAGIEQVADGHDDFVGVCLLAGVGEIEGLNGLLIEIGMLLPGVLSDEDGVGGDGLVEGSGESADYAEVRQTGNWTLLRSTGMQLGGVVGVEEDVRIRPLWRRWPDR